MTSPVSMGATTYQSWSNEALINRVTELEKQLCEKNQNSIAVRNDSPASSLRFQRPAKKRKPNRGKAFDSSRYNTRFIALKIAYLGHKYNGFEGHVANSTPLPTIEEVLWHALVKTKLIFKSEDEPLDWEGCDYSKCGRTDKGVSAFGQVIGIRVRSNRAKETTQAHEPVEDGANGMDDAQADLEPSATFDDIYDEISYPHILNRCLPSDIRVLAWCPSPPPGFSARFSCRQRKYRYFFTQPAWCPGSPTGAPNAQPAGWLDIEAMSVAAQKLEGLHDFRNFCKVDASKQIQTFERRIEHAKIVPLPEQSLGLSFDNAGSTSTGHCSAQMYSFDVSGSAFLWHQVRCMVAVLFLIGQGFEAPELINELLDVESTPGRPLYHMADDRPLVLWECMFPAAGEKPTADPLHWVYAGDQHPPGDPQNMARTPEESRHGVHGINDILWEEWHAKKIDELLAAEMLNTAHSMPLPQVPSQQKPTNRTVKEPLARLFDGSGALKSKGKYVPVMERERMETPDVLNGRWRERTKKAITNAVDADVGG